MVASSARREENPERRESHRVNVLLERRLAAVADAAGVRFAVCDPEGRVQHPAQMQNTWVWESFGAGEDAIRKIVQQALEALGPVSMNVGGWFWTVIPISAMPFQVEELVITVARAN
jgi:hypothetical protein